MSTRIEEDTIVSELEIEAPPAIVFAALTDPKQLQQWWGDEKTYRADHWTVDARKGGKWRSEGKSVTGQPFFVEGEYLEIDPPKVLAYTWKPSWIEVSPTVVRFVLTARGNGTHLVVTHSGFSGNNTARDNHAQGWPGVLNWLRVYVERR